MGQPASVCDSLPEGKGEFCLPTKLHAPPRPADRVIGRVSCALNASGLFARVKHTSLLGNTITVLVFVKPRI
jgi:hypothetical protein